MIERLVGGPARAYAADIAEAIAELAPDVVVVDEFLFGAAAAAEAWGGPWVVLMPNLYLLPTPDRPTFGPGFAPAVTAADRERDRAVSVLGAELWATGLPALNAARADLGLPPLTDPLEQVARADAVVALSSRAFDHPGQFPARVVHTGPRLDDPPWAAAPWSPRPGDDPLVLVSLSSSDQGQLEVLRRIVEALASLPVRAVVTTGPCVDPRRLPAPPQVSVLPAAPCSRGGWPPTSPAIWLATAPRTRWKRWRPRSPLSAGGDGSAPGAPGCDVPRINGHLGAAIE